MLKNVFFYNSNNCKSFCERVEKRAKDYNLRNIEQFLNEIILKKDKIDEFDKYFNINKCNK